MICRFGARCWHCVGPCGVDARYPLVARLLAILMCIVAAGCATTPGDLTEVRVPVAVPCVAEAEIPRASFLTDAQLAALPDGPLVLALARDRLDRALHIARLEAILQGCVRE